MDKLAIEKAILLGFSDGANIARQFTLEHPDRVRALILNGGNLNPKGVKRSTQLSIIPGNHFIANQEPTAFNREVDRFLEIVGI